MEDNKEFFRELARELKKRNELKFTITCTQLQDLINKACEKQRENCAVALRNNKKLSTQAYFDANLSVSNAPQPKLEDLA